MRDLIGRQRQTHRKQNHANKSGIVFALIALAIALSAATAPKANATGSTSEPVPVSSVPAHKKPQAGVGVATAGSAPVDTNCTVCVATVSLAHALAGDVASALRAVYPGVTFSADPRSNTLFLRGSPDQLKKARSQALALDKITASTGDEEVHVFPVPSDAASNATSIANDILAFIQGQPPSATTPSGSKGSASPSPAPDTTPTPSAVILAPSGQNIIVRADVRMMKSIIAIYDTLTATPSPNKPPSSQTYTSYEVRYAIPNPVPSGLTLAATSTISDLATTVQNIINQTGTSDVRLMADPSYPRIIVAGSNDGVKNALRTLVDLDKRPALVDIEAQIYELDVNAADNLGLSLPTGSIQTTVGEYFPAPLTGSPRPQPLLQVGQVVRPPFSIAVQLNTMIANGTATLVADPHVATINGRMTFISTQNIIPFVANSVNSAGLSVSNVTNYQTGTRLDIVPIINVDGSITAYIHPSYANLTGLSVQNAPLISTREASTTFRLVSGQSVYISGLQEINEATTIQKIPGLGQIPLIGKAFQQKVYNSAKTQLFIVLNATIVDRGDLGIQSIAPDPSGTPRAFPQQKALAPPPFVPAIPTPTPTPTPTPHPSSSPDDGASR